MRKLKKWNGRGHHNLESKHIYVAAYNQKQAAELVGKACGLKRSIGVYEIRVYYSNCWGTPMEDIEPTEPCVWIEYDDINNKKPKKVL